MLYVDDKLPRHPKIFRAGAKLGPNGPALALAMFMDGLAYAREHLTDGFLPDAFVASCGLVQTPQSVALALSSRAVKLWHKTRGGYQINDYHDWNRKASEIKKNREKWREKKAGQRRGKNGEFGSVSPDVSPGDEYRDSRARASTYHVPRTTRTTTNQLVLVPPGQVQRVEGTNLPPLSRRDSRTLLKTSEPEGVTDASTEGTETGRVAAALCDRSRAADGGPDDRRRRMEGADQGTALPPGVRLPGGLRHDSAGDERGREGALGEVGAAAGGPAAATGAAAAAAPGGSTVEPSPATGRSDVDRGAAREPAPLRALRDVLAHLPKCAGEQA